MSATYRWYVIGRPSAHSVWNGTEEEGKWIITAWSRTNLGALRRKPVPGYVVQASTRKQAATKAKQQFGIEVVWRKWKPRSLWRTGFTG